MVRLALQMLYRRRYSPPKWNHPLYGKHGGDIRVPGLMKGKYPITRKKSYLEKGITFRDCVKALTIHFGNYSDKNHEGTRFALDNGEKIIVDTDGKNQFEILKHINKVVGKPKKLLAIETAAVEENPANFGRNSERKCMCMVEGQVPCSGTKTTTPGNPRHYAGKNKQLNFKQLLYGKE